MTYDQWKTTEPDDGREPPRQPSKIVTHFWPKPIPIRHMDWTATFDNYEGGDGYNERPGPIGYGRTEAEAIADLLETYGD